MNRYRGTAVLLVTLFTLVVLGVALYVLTPRRDLGEVQSNMAHTLVAAVAGLRQRCHLPPGPSLESLRDTPWGWAAGLAAVVSVLMLLQRHGDGR